MEQNNLYKSRVLTRYELNAFNQEHPTCLFYIWETKCICALDTPYRKGDNLNTALDVHQTEIEASKNEKYQVAWGYPAFLLANWRTLSNTKDAKKILENYIRADVKQYVSYDTILQDWQKTLNTYIGTKDTTIRAGLWSVGNIIKQLFFTTAKDVSLEDIFHPEISYFQPIGEPKSLYAELVPSGTHTGENIETFSKLVLATDRSTISFFVAARKNIWAAYGFSAVLIHCAIRSYYYDLWDNMSFGDPKVIDFMIQQMSTLETPIVNLKELNFKFSFSYLDFIKKYIAGTVENVRKAISQNPDYPFELSEGNNIYSYILWAEKTAFQVFVANQLYASFTRDQQNQLQTFFCRYLEYLSKNYGANEEFMNRINMREYGHIEPLQISFTSHIKVIDKDGNDVTLERAHMSGLDKPSAEKKITKSIPDFIVSTKYVDVILSRVRDWANSKTKTKDKLMALRAAIDAGVIRRPTEKEFKTAFPDISVPKSCLSDYTNPDKTPYCDFAFSNLVEEFKQYK